MYGVYMVRRCIVFVLYVCAWKWYIDYVTVTMYNCNYVYRNNKGVFRQSHSSLSMLNQGISSDTGNVSDSCTSTVNGDTGNSNGSTSGNGKESSLTYFAAAALAALENNESNSRSSRRISGTANGTGSGNADNGMGVGIASQESNGSTGSNGRSSRIATGTGINENHNSNTNNVNSRPSSGKSTPTNVHVPPQPPRNNYNQTRTIKLTNITSDNITSGSRIKRK